MVKFTHMRACGITLFFVRPLTRLLLFLISVAILTGPVQAQDVRVATMRLGTAWYVFGATLYKLMRDEMPEGMRFEVMAKGGGVGNPILVDTGRASMALANVCAAVWARNGHPIAYDGREYRNLTALVGGLNSVWFGAMVREDYVTRTGNDTLEKILLGPDPVRIVMKPRGSTIPVIADMVFAALGTSREEIAAKGGRVMQLETQQIAEMIRGGRADVYFEAAPLGQPTITELSLTTNLRFLDLPERVTDALAEDGLRPSSIPQFFRGQTGPTASVDMGTLVIAHRDMPEDLAYLITRTICENQEVMMNAHRAWARFDPARAGWIENRGIPLHPGARRFYEERGWLRPDEAP